MYVPVSKSKIIDVGQGILIAFLRHWSVYVGIQIIIKTF